MSEPFLNRNPAIVAAKLRQLRTKKEASEREYNAYLEAVTHANFIRIFHRDRELQEPATRLHPDPAGT